MQQAVARPVTVDLQAFIESEGYQAESVSILTNFPMPYPQSLEGKLADLQRDEDLAQKYGIGLLDKSDEFFEDTTGSLNYRVMPVVYAGLEYTDDETLGSAMKPGLWPLQEEEWALDYWLDRGVGVIIYSNFYNELVSREMAEMRVFLAEVEERCARTFHIEPVKPLYVEYSATVFDCRGI